MFACCKCRINHAKVNYVLYSQGRQWSYSSWHIIYHIIYDVTKHSAYSESSIVVGQAVQTPHCCTPISDVASRRHLRSANRRQLLVPRHNLSTYGRRAFSVAVPAALNCLSDELREPLLTANSFRQFSDRLVCLLSTSAHSALDVLHIMRYIKR